MNRTSLAIAKFLLIALGAAFPLQLRADDKTPSGSAAGIPDIATFMKIGSCSSPTFGANRELFFRSSISGASQFYRLTSEGWPYQLTVFDDGIDWYSLAPDGNYAIIGASKGGSEQSQLYLLETGSGSIRQITNIPQVQFGSVIWKNDNSGFYFRSNQVSRKDFRIYYHSLADRRDTLVFDMEGSNQAVGLSPDERYLLILHNYSNYNNDLFLLNLQSGSKRLLTEHEGDILHDAIFMTADNESIYMLCNNNAEGTMQRTRLEIATGKQETLDPDLKWNVDALSLSPNRRFMAWLVNEEGYSQIRLYDLTGETALPVPHIQGVIESVEIDDDGVIVFPYTTATRTQDIWIWDWRGPELRKMTHSIYAGVDPSLFLEPTLIKYRTFDGREIPAFLYLPPAYDGKPIPFIVHIHGGPESQFQPYFQRNFQYLLLNGYGIFAPNIRGSSGYGKEYLNLDNYKNRLNSIKDIKAGCEYLIEKGYTRKGNMGIKGTSYGGYAVLAAITEYPDLFGAAFDEVGIANFVTFLKNTADYRRKNREAEYGPLSDSAFLYSISPIRKASAIKTPLLVVHGENDPRVPIGEARQIIQAIQDNGGVVDSLIFSNEGHGSGRRDNTIELYQKMVGFFDRYLKKGD